MAPATRANVIVTLPADNEPLTLPGAGSRPLSEIFGPWLRESWLGPGGLFGGTSLLKCLHAGRPAAESAYARVAPTPPVSRVATTAVANNDPAIQRTLLIGCLTPLPPPRGPWSRR